MSWCQVNLIVFEVEVTRELLLMYSLVEICVGFFFVPLSINIHLSYSKGRIIWINLIFSTKTQTAWQSPSSLFLSTATLIDEKTAGAEQNAELLLKCRSKQSPFSGRALCVWPVSALSAGGGDHRVHSDSHCCESLWDWPAGHPRWVQEAVWIHALLQAGGRKCFSTRYCQFALVQEAVMSQRSISLWRVLQTQG